MERTSILFFQLVMTDVNSVLMRTQANVRCARFNRSVSLDILHLRSVSFYVYIFGSYFSFTKNRAFRQNTENSELVFVNFVICFLSNEKLAKFFNVGAATNTVGNVSSCVQIV